MENTDSKTSGIAPVRKMQKLIWKWLMRKWYGTFPIGEHGVFTINRTKAKMLLGRKLSQQRKPSTYKRKANAATSGDSNATKKAKTNVEEGSGEDVIERAEVSTLEEGKDSESDQEAESKTKNKRNSPVSRYEQEKLKRVEENNLMLLKQNIISHTFASIAALFFLNAKKLRDVTVMSVKKALTQLGVTVPKGQSYGEESLVILLGKELFGKGKVRRKDETKVIFKDNLVLVE